MHILKSQSVLLTTVSVVSLLLGGCLNTGQLSSASSCSALGPCSTSSGSGGGTGGGTGGGGTSTTSSPFKLTLKSYWYGDTGKLNPSSHSLYQMTGDTLGTVTTTSCIIPSGTPPAQPGNSTSAIQTCGVKIPETQLALSALEFTVDAPTNHSCDVVYLYPHFYRASASKKYYLPGATDGIDCEKGDNKLCYAGPAVNLIQDFPKTTGEINPIQDRTVAYQKSWTAKSSIEFYGMSFSTSNRYTGFHPFSIASSTDEAKFYVNKPWTWNFICVQKGSSRSYEYTVRIFPVKDTDFFEGAPRKYGWLDDDGNVLGEARRFDFSPQKGPIDGDTVLTVTGTTVQETSSIFFYTENGEKECTIDVSNPQKCTLPSIGDSGTTTDLSTAFYLGSQSGSIIPSIANFTFMALRTPQISPASGSSAGGTLIAFTGEGIAKNATITIGGVGCTVIASSWANDGTSIQCTTGAKAASTGNDVVITNPTSGQTKTLTGAFTYN